MLALMGIVLIATSMSAVITPGMAQASGYVEIVNRGSGKCMTIQNGSVGAGAVLIQQTCNSLPYQKWMLIGGPSGTSEIYSPYSGLCMSWTYLSPVSNGQEMDQQACGGIPYDQLTLWVLTNVTTTPVRTVMIRLNGYDACMDLEDGWTWDGVAMQIWECNPNTNNQKWNLYPTV